MLCYPKYFKERNLFGLICCTTTYEVYKTLFELYRQYLPAQFAGPAGMAGSGQAEARGQWEAR
ncbi:hypothetical protein BN2475_830007 [Paraburkholderia ribeironis]|uniref:Uncharacterized protein n=1 Tax=Paraburkholderia ribeironis TaxID=1247936 RepID=A0A1N7SKA9_9BURK|nr:hypothetical protein BN2475_830007 [Paraburkholderia ribeironis]